MSDSAVRVAGARPCQPQAAFITGGELAIDGGDTAS